MRRRVVGLAFAVGLASLMSNSPAGATGFHCPGTPGGRARTFLYEATGGSEGPTGEPTPTKAFKAFLRTGSDGWHLPLTEWTHPSKNLFVYSGIRGNIQVTTFRTQRGSYVVGHANQNCSTF